MRFFVWISSAFMALLLATASAAASASEPAGDEIDYSMWVDFTRPGVITVSNPSDVEIQFTYAAHQGDEHSDTRPILAQQMNVPVQVGDLTSVYWFIYRDTDGHTQSGEVTLTPPATGLDYSTPVFALNTDCRIQLHNPVGNPPVRVQFGFYDKWDPSWRHQSSKPMLIQPGDFITIEPKLEFFGWAVYIDGVHDSIDQSEDFVTEQCETPVPTPARQAPASQSAPTTSTSTSTPSQPAVASAEPRTASPSAAPSGQSTVEPELELQSTEAIDEQQEPFSWGPVIAAVIMVMIISVVAARMRRRSQK